MKKSEIYLAGQSRLNEPTPRDPGLPFQELQISLKDIPSPVRLPWFFHYTQALFLISQGVSGNFQIQRDSFWFECYAPKLSVPSQEGTQRAHNSHPATVAKLWASLDTFWWRQKHFGKNNVKGGGGAVRTLGRNKPQASPFPMSSFHHLWKDGTGRVQGLSTFFSPKEIFCQ